MARAVDLSGVSIVCAGSFNPAIFHPSWFVQRSLIADSAAQEAFDRDQVLSTSEVSTFSADWLSVQVTLHQAVFATVEEGREFDLRDLAIGVFNLLPETPVSALGINADVHSRLDSEEAWHAIGDAFLPKDQWEPLFPGDRWKRRSDGQAVGLRSLSLETHREDVHGFMRIEVGPSVRITPYGVYAGVNSHFQLSEGTALGNGSLAAHTLAEQWEETRAIEQELLSDLMDKT